MSLLQGAESSQTQRTKETPTSESSQGQGDEQTSRLGSEQTLEQLDSLVEKALAKALTNPAFLQSVKDKTLSDKRVLQSQQTLKDIQSVLERFKGVVPDDQLAQIQRDIEFDDLKQRVYGGESTGDSKAGKPESAANDFTKAIDDAFNLPDNDSRVTQLKLDHGNDSVAYLRGAVQLAAKLAGKDESTPGEQPIAQGRAPVQPEVNPIEKIEDSRTLYRLAAEQMAKETPRRRR